MLEDIFDSTESVKDCDVEYQRQGKSYAIMEKKLLTDEEKSLINKQLIEELEVE